MKVSARFLHGMGSHVTQVYRGDLFLRGFDDDVREVLAEEMRKQAIDLRFGVNVATIERRDGALAVTLDDGSALQVDQVLSATGRLPHTRDLGLVEAGVKLNVEGAVLVDEFSCSSVPSIYAVGDVTDRINLTPVAIHEGAAVAATLFGGKPTRPDHSDVPSAVFSQPNIATVGLTESQARLQYPEIDVYKTRFRPLKHTLTGRAETIMMKLVVDRASDRARLPAMMVGAEAAEIVQGLAVAIMQGHQGAVRFHDRHPPDQRRGVRGPCAACPPTRSPAASKRHAVRAMDRGRGRVLRPAANAAGVRRL
jgi:glutathione reductase (NADPH)